MRMLWAGLLAVVAAACAVAQAEETRTDSVVVAGDSVLVTIALTDNAAAQAVSVDSVEFYAEITGMVGGGRNKKVAKTTSPTTGTVSYPLSLWAPNQTKGGKVGARLGHTEGGVTAWSAWTYNTTPGWSYTRVVPAPTAPDAAAVSGSAVLN